MEVSKTQITMLQTVIVAAIMGLDQSLVPARLGASNLLVPRSVLIMLSKEADVNGPSLKAQ